MPYRRLPNTDNARIRALKTAIEKNNTLFGEGVISLNIQNMELMLRNFENAQYRYRESLETQAAANRKFQKLIKNARLYISHFIQVLNFCVIRNEIKKEQKQLYGLDPDNFSVPDLTSNDSLLYWGENIIKGEQARLVQGGVPVYNPTIARVNVAFSQFKDAYFTQKTYQNTTTRQLDTLSEQRDDIDATLTVLWNQIEAAFASLPSKERLERCKEYGVVYYLRKEEKKKIESENN
ncbi:hypothetical protein M2451_000804 [Dysgonomonas sp. PFB1-18]|uniref:hypothetical protein n=1 Tax=unclassified Dysgonomonas TaxID=2630389 RepID=UPI0024759736|nr:MULTISPECIES: hypothetical protein [unclassified Dysgonomonas]MDH6308493.1 hypothetical protein [Dysgonomonas sp. PF1-14]MDH6337994.1 hypothetical protein [Dysgonomonas sp. PF1-16]MDH6379491.1 hypothetical protein [Dysgonomonas sp. PFB1-18]MDH6396822.1 hypothetical protein [Dysgonomonas sp. PF1-23]